jgi:DNA-binding MarR family transcriptional regulator
VTKAEDAHCPSPEDVRVLQMWGRTHAAVESLTETVYADVASRTGLPRSSFEALWFLYFATGRSAPMSALGRELRFSTAGITKLTDRLAGSGLLRRAPDATDRRVTLAELTEQGVQAVEEAGLVLAEAVRTRIVAEIGLAQFEELATLLTRLSPVNARCPSTARGGQPVG